MPRASPVSARGERAVPRDRRNRIPGPLSAGDRPAIEGLDCAPIPGGGMAPTRRVFFAAASIAALVPSIALADPCGMVPPVAIGVSGPVITRTGAQRTYVFYSKGMETYVIRPGFSGKVD